MKRVLTGVLGLVLGMGSAVAQQTNDKTAQHSHEHAVVQAVPVQNAVPETDGEIIKVDSAARTLTVKHGRIASLDMAPMTMPYEVRDPSFINLVKPGDKVKIAVEQIDGTYTIVALKRVP